MKMKPSVFFVIVLIFLAGSINVDAANMPASIPPANEPWSIEHVDWYPGAGVGTNVSIAHHPTTGVAYISYYDYLNNELWMAHEVEPGTGNCHNNDDWYCQVIDSEGDVGKYNSIDVIRVPADPPIPGYTKIGISYYDATNGALKYASYRSFPAPGSWTIYQVDMRVFVNHETRGTFSTMKFNADHLPVIAYHAMSDFSGLEYGAVKIASYVASGGSGCNSVDGEYWVCNTIDRIDSVDQLDHGIYPSLDFTWDGSVQIAFYNSQQHSLDFAWYYGFGGGCSNSEWNCVTIDDGIDRGEYVSLHSKDSVSDKTRLAYYNAYNGMLKYAESVGSGGNCYSTAYNCYDVDEIGTPIGDIDISLDMDSQGYPIIAYTDASEDLAPLGLNIARPAPAYGEETGNCGTRPGDLFYYWICKSLDNGAAYADEARFVAVSVSPAGLATIAYSEYNSYDDETYLKVARQHFMNYLPMIKK